MLWLNLLNLWFASWTQLSYFFLLHTHTVPKKSLGVWVGLQAQGRACRLGFSFLFFKREDNKCFFKKTTCHLWAEILDTTVVAKQNRTMFHFALKTQFLSHFNNKKPKIKPLRFIFLDLNFSFQTILRL